MLKHLSTDTNTVGKIVNFIEEEIESLKVEHKRGDNIDHVRGAISAYTAMYEFLKSDMILPG